VSLINQVLKDLEQRHASEMAASTDNLDGLAMAAPMISGNERRQTWLLPIIIFIVAAVTAVVVWWWQERGSTIRLIESEKATQTKVVTRIAAADKQASETEKHKAPAKVNVPDEANHQQKHVSQPPAKSVQVKAHKTRKRQPHPQVAKVKTEPHVNKQMLPMRRDQRAELAYQSAYDQIQSEHITRAEELLRQALAADPMHVRARELLAGLLIKQGRWVENASLMQQAVQLYPRNPLFVKLYARTLMQMGRDGQAIQLLHNHAPAVAQDPDYYALLAALYQRQQQHQAAVKILATDSGDQATKWNLVGGPGYLAGSTG